MDTGVRHPIIVKEIKDWCWILVVLNGLRSQQDNLVNPRKDGHRRNGLNGSHLKANFKNCISQKYSNLINNYISAAGLRHATVF